MEKKDVAVVTEKLNEHLRKYKLHIQFTKEEVAHFLLPRVNVVESFVIIDAKD